MSEPKSMGEYLELSEDEKMKLTEQPPTVPTVPGEWMDAPTIPGYYFVEKRDKSWQSIVDISQFCINNKEFATGTAYVNWHPFKFYQFSGPIPLPEGWKQ